VATVRAEALAAPTQQDTARTEFARHLAKGTRGEHKAWHGRLSWCGAEHMDLAMNL